MTLLQAGRGPAAFVDGPAALKPRFYIPFRKGKQDKPPVAGAPPAPEP